MIIVYGCCVWLLCVVVVCGCYVWFRLNTCLEVPLGAHHMVLYTCACCIPVHAVYCAWCIRVHAVYCAWCIRVHLCLYPFLHVTNTHTLNTHILNTHILHSIQVAVCRLFARLTPGHRLAPALDVSYVTGVLLLCSVLLFVISCGWW